ncbi:vitelline membrane outer layer protein 1-like [Pituophis catenifer annectens]|uniref:vitelline membrane outer layer protein 1-like n=1 Tax=Pituophis catenifer annectens TaxID=94852 RepID=UPI00399149B3
MDPRFSSAVFLILSCWLWNAECRDYNQILKVPNGGQWGEWGELDMCPTGYAGGFVLKVQQPQGISYDDTSLNGIGLICTGNILKTSTIGEVGDWGLYRLCSGGNLMSFALRVEGNQTVGDDTAANNIKFICGNEGMLQGFSNNWGRYGPWSDSCEVGAICGIKTKVERFRTSMFTDNTGLNDVQFVCCD